MAIEAKRRKLYGGAVVTQKYSPLEDIKYKSSQTDEYSALLTNRLDQLTNARVLPQPLVLVTDWASQLPTGAGTDPPLLVISSNRSNWIAAGVELSTKQWNATNYEGSSDLNALTGLAGKQTQSPPLYVPRRSEGNRKIYILVHMHEYHQYTKALADTGITVVGWSFRTPTTAPGPLTGFGASRYAAIEFCKHLRANMTGDKWDYAWLLDDNVVAMTNFPGYTAVEVAMRAATTEQVCSAFHGGSSVESFEKIRDWAADEVNATPTRAKPTDLPEPEATRGIIQQAALWNIKYLTEKKLNFSPLFVASGEDVSLGNYFNADIPARKPAAAKPPIPYLYYGGITVLKEAVNYQDDGRGAKLVSKARDDYQKWFADEEAKARSAGRTLPPPVEIESSGTQKLSDFITTWFKETEPTRKPLVAGAHDPKVQDKAKCQAVEQIACGAIGSTYVTKAAVDRTFESPGDGQVIHRRPPPKIRT